MSNTKETSLDVTLALEQFKTLLVHLDHQSATGELDARVIEGQAGIVTNMLTALSESDRAETIKRCRLAAIECDGRGDQACALVGIPIPYRRSFLLEESADDEGNARCIKAMYGQDFLHCDAYGWMRHTGRHWDRLGAEATLDVAALETLKARRRVAVEAEREAIVKTTRGTAANVRNAKYLFSSFVDVRVSEFDRSPDHLNCLNGVLDLRTGDLVTHESGQRFTYCLPVAYDPDADQTPWLEFLHGVTTARVVATYLQECVGYSMTGYTWEECLFHISGPTRSGKGTFTETILHMMGREPLAVEADYQTFTMRRDGDAQNFDLAGLKPCRIVAASESKREQRLNAEKVKGMTGGNLIRCAFKHKDHFTYRPQFKVWLTSNWPVNADPDDAALWARLRVVKFPHSHLGHEDKALKRSLRQPDKLAGVLAWAVAGARRWYDRGNVGLIEPDVVKRETDDARLDLDYVSQWVSECLVRSDDAGAFIPNDALYGSYNAWCSAVGVTAKKLTALTQSLKAKGYDAGAPKRHKGKTARGCVGVQFKQDPAPAPIEL